MTESGPVSIKFGPPPCRAVLSRLSRSRRQKFSAKAEGSFGGLCAFSRPKAGCRPVCPRQGARRPVPSRPRIGPAHPILRPFQGNLVKARQSQSKSVKVKNVVLCRQMAKNSHIAGLASGHSPPSIFCLAARQSCLIVDNRGIFCAISAFCLGMPGRLVIGGPLPLSSPHL